MPVTDTETLKLAEVEQATGLSRDVLRKWEIRYGFPIPVRGNRGERQYAVEDVHKLTLVKQLIGRGLRPRNLVNLSVDALEALLKSAPAVPLASADTAAVQLLHACLRPGAEPDAVRRYLGKLILEEGMAHFVHHHLPMFNQAVGDAWAAGYLGIHVEHHYTETVRALVLSALAARPVNVVPGSRQTKVLLTTPPGELHGLGVLALQTALSFEGAECISLGTQTPVADVVRAVAEWGIGIVSISASSAFQPSAAKSYVLALRRLLPATCYLWLGGQGANGLFDEPFPGVEVVQTLSEASARWRSIASVDSST